MILFVQTGMYLLMKTILNKILSGKDLIHEDYKLFVQHGGGEKGTPPVPSYEFDHKYFESLKSKLSRRQKTFT